VEQRFEVDGGVVGEEELRTVRRLVSSVTGIQVERIHSHVYFKLQGALAPSSSHDNVSFGEAEAVALHRALASLLEMPLTALSVTLAPPMAWLDETAHVSGAGGESVTSRATYVPGLTFSVPSSTEALSQRRLEELKSSISGAYSAPNFYGTLHCNF
jgi:hypothetical protein